MRSICVILSLFLASPTLAAEDKLIIHEWGTFTSLQDETGRSIGGINSDDEPLPAFVRTLESSVVIGSPSVLDLRYKGLPRVHPDVTMRLETPVIYFYPPKDATLPMTIDVSAEFHGGWLTQFYPGALAVASGFGDATKPGSINESTIGRLTWKHLQIGTESAGPKTDSKIWLAPRDVKAAHVTSAGGESESYLFYRGVGHLESPLKVVRRDDKLMITGRNDALSQAVGARAIDHIWLVAIRPDGRLAYRLAGSSNIMERAIRPDQLVPATFADADFATDAAPRLRDEMSAAMEQQGLFADEARAMLKTWEHSYFQSPGVRLFYLVPQAWTDHLLPLKISSAADITRVMIGRIELVTPRQRDIVRRMTNGDLMGESATHARTELGRFGDALLMDAQNRASENSAKRQVLKTE